MSAKNRSTLPPQYCDTSTLCRGKSSNGRSCLVPKTVIGSTISSINALSTAYANTFAFCAGSTVVLAAINEHLALEQRRLFCVKPDALPTQATPTYYNSATPTKATGTRSTYANSPCTDDSPSTAPLPASSEYNTDNQNRLKGLSRSRSLSSVSLSPSGNLLAVGEVNPRVASSSLSKLMVLDRLPTSGPGLLHSFRQSFRIASGLFDRTHIRRPSSCILA